MSSNAWKSTLRLPYSSFLSRPSPEYRDRYIKRCADELYQWQKQKRAADVPFMLHDGPPYANGDLHVGHALNKILKDMILRVKVQQGRRVEYVPGWDCHGLPIELKALERAQGEKLTPIQIRQSARNLAAQTVLKQMESFRSYGVMGDWDKRWTTMDAVYEMRQLRLFQKMVQKGLIYRKYKPVYWSPSSQTALAESELEYKDNHVSHSAWVRFPITPGWRDLPQFEDVQDRIHGGLYALIWTTTPWTLPANRAIAVHSDLQYCVVSDGENALLVAESRLDALNAKLAGQLVFVKSIEGKQLEGLQYANRLRGRAASPQPVIHADFVAADSGSGLVHLAPGHGFDDYEVCSALGIPAEAPIDDEGRFTKDAFPDAPEILASAPSVNQGGGKHVLGLVRQHGDVLLVERYRHKYPYDWRTKRPVVIRATEQWFADVGHIKAEALQALDHVRFFPESGRNRLESFVRGRNEWCVSRQRAWGVPIPALYDDTGSAVVNDEVIEHIISVIQERGTQAWWSDAPDDPAWIPSSMTGQGSFRRGTDTMDVWFDSGSSWSMTPARADVYLEGSDQHRGWFQSSLLTRIAAGAEADAEFEKGAPFKQLITHGFTLDQEKKKMSKSLGNIIAPQQVMDGTLLPVLKRKGQAAKHDALGPDALRLWAASGDYTSDVLIGADALKTVHGTYLKCRTILKMLLGSMHPSGKAPLTVVDEIALVQLEDTMQEVGKAYDNHEFHRAVLLMMRWVNTDLSSWYLDARKDRMYCGDGGCVAEPIFHGLLRMLAPVTPLLVEEAWDHRPDWMRADPSLVHPLRQLYADSLYDPARLTRDQQRLRADDIPVLMATYRAITSCQEPARRANDLGMSLACDVDIAVPSSSSSSSTSSSRVRRVLEGVDAEDLAELFIVSRVTLVDPHHHASATPDDDDVDVDVVTAASSDHQSGGNSSSSPAGMVVENKNKRFAYRKSVEIDGVPVVVTVRNPRGAKCPRCWRYVAPSPDALCARCGEVTARMEGK
ncbi:isoleucyl-tRNA synthetase [Xylariaceae sp. FL0804]|nr:isoleucyl-tRNA synthetase [Xylariaceae sp. FL0804]